MMTIQRGNTLFRKLPPLFCLCAALVLAGCVGGGAARRDGIPPDGAAVSERAAGSLGFDVLDYNWTYLNEGAHIRIKGRVRNSSGEAFQAVILQGLLYDQRGRLVARGASYIVPTYLKPGAVGEFEIVTAAARDSGVASTRLVTDCQTNAL